MKTYPFDKRHLNFDDPEVLKEMIGKNLEKNWKETYGVDFAALADGDGSEVGIILADGDGSEVDIILADGDGSEVDIILADGDDSEVDIILVILTLLV